MIIFYLFIYSLNTFMKTSLYFTFLKLIGHGHLKSKFSAISCNEILQSSILPVPRMDVNEYF